jgi:hypothetical protein
MTNGNTLHKKAIVPKFGQANVGISGSDDQISDTTNIENHWEVNNVGEERTLHDMATVHDMLEMWQGS